METQRNHPHTEKTLVVMLGRAGYTATLEGDKEWVVTGPEFSTRGARLFSLATQAMRHKNAAKGGVYPCPTCGGSGSVVK